MHKKKIHSSEAICSRASSRVFALRFIAAGLLVFALLLVCISLGSVNIPLKTVLQAVLPGTGSTNAAGSGAQDGQTAIIRTVRLPRVLCAALSGAALSLCGGAMQGLLKNPLADGSTLGVSSGASLGAALAIVCGLRFPHLPFSATAVMAALFAFLSLFLILGLSQSLDHSLSTNTVILVGVIFSMFVSGILSVLITLAPSKLKSITFWTMGSLSGSSMRDAAVLAGALLIFGGILLFYAEELNAFGVGEENALHIGVNVRRVKLAVLLCVSALTGICVSVGGTIGFVGLVTPHMMRALTGPNHRRLLPACILGGAALLLLSDLLARMLLRPLEMPIGSVTSFFGALLFLHIFRRQRRGL